MEQTQKLATEFCRVLRQWLTPDHLAEAVRRNRTRAYEGSCATHDFCDANMVMLEAAGNSGVSEEDYETWNAAWDIAKKSEFELR